MTPEPTVRHLIVLRFIALALLVIVTSAIGFGSGCKTQTTAPVVGGATTNAVRAWATGLVLTFSAPPTSRTLELLSAAGAQTRDGELVFVLERYDRSNAAQNDAIEAALREGATLTGTP